MTFPDLKSHYKYRYDKILLSVAAGLESYVKGIVKGYPRLDRVSARPKAVDRFLEKAARREHGAAKYSDPMNQIQDQIGARIVTFFLSDVEAISATIEQYFASIEKQHIVPDSPKEFGYEGKHYILFLPEDVKVIETRDDCPTFFELQIKTLFQHAWAEADHDLIYKPSGDLTSDQRRRVAFTAAQAWGADWIFEEARARAQSNRVKASTERHRERTAFTQNS